MNRFQIILLVVFGFFILAAVITFSFYRGGSGSAQYTVNIWGALPSSAINTVISDSNFSPDNTVRANYVKKDAGSLVSDFTEALAQGNGPDLIILTQEDLWQARKKLTLIPYTSVSQRDYLDAFIDGANIFLTQEGAYALPLVVDPMILYYNKSILSSAGIAKPLSFWDEIYNQATRLTTKDEAGNITQTTIAMGETKNIAHYKDVLSLLMLQAGTMITNPEYYPKSLLTQTYSLPVSPAVSALDFYTQFANPSKIFHSWNKELPEALNFFASGDSAYYLGFASEVPLIKSKSPTLSFGVTTVPQSRSAGKATYGRIYSIALSRGSKNTQASLSIALKLIATAVEKSIATSLNLAPARKDGLLSKPTDAVGPVVYDGALQSKTWIDPDSAQSKAVFKEMIENVTSGRTRSSEAVNRASERLESLFNN